MSELQKQINQIEIYSNDNEMEINTKKTKAMIFNKPRRRINLLPNIKLSNETLEVIDETKLLCVFYFK